MDEELEKEIARVKQKIADYIRIAPLIGATEKDREKQIDLMLDDLIILLKKRK